MHSRSKFLLIPEYKTHNPLKVDWSLPSADGAQALQSSVDSNFTATPAKHSGSLRLRGSMPLHHVMCCFLSAWTFGAATAHDNNGSCRPKSYVSLHDSDRVNQRAAPVWQQFPQLPFLPQMPRF